MVHYKSSSSSSSSLSYWATELPYMSSLQWQTTWFCVASLAWHLTRFGMRCVIHAFISGMHHYECVAPNHHHHHHGAKRSAVASIPPLRFATKTICPQPGESISHRYSRVAVPADLMDACGERSASSAPPVGWWPDAVLSWEWERERAIVMCQ